MYCKTIQQMETDIIQKIKNKAGKLFEDNLFNTGKVLEVRCWEPETVIEIDLHLSRANMSNWTDVPYIKFKVDSLTYRDYTPSCWDAETNTCTIFIDAAHNGAGANWAKALKKDSIVIYSKAGSSRQQPDKLKSIIALGDQSSLGHLLALQQMTLPITRFSGAIVMNNDKHIQQFAEYFKSPLLPVIRKDTHGHNTLMEWVVKQQCKLEDVVFYLVGNTTMVTQLKKLLKQQGYNSAQIKALGFWS